MEIDDNGPGRFSDDGNRILGPPKGAIIVSHEDASEERNDRILTPAPPPVDSPSPAIDAGWIIRGAEDTLVVADEGNALFLVPNVIAAGQNVDSG